jgi:hypothetical protein
MHISTRRHLSRRRFLRGLGTTLSLPLLDAMIPAFARGHGAAAAPPRRMIAVMTNMGILPQHFFPQQPGRDYESTRYLEALKDFRQQMTVFSGVAHPEVDGGHHADIAWFTGAPHPGRAGFRNTISLDQFAAERIGHHTRFPSLSLLVGVEGKRSLSWTPNGVMIPSEKKASEVFKRLFIQGTPAEVQAQVARLREGQSILDAVAGRAKSLERSLGGDDRAKLDQYFTSVREAEQRLHKAEAWEHQPKPKVDAKPPVDIADPADLVGKSRLMYDMAALALQSDCTRLITIFIEEDHNPTVKVPGVTQGHHSLTHHGNKPEALDELSRIEEAQFGTFKDLLAKLRAHREQDSTLLDSTAVLYGTNMGNANAHSNDNLPFLLAGGAFKHAGHIAFDKKRNEPLANAFVSVLQHLGVEADRFASSTGTMKGLELARSI